MNTNETIDTSNRVQRRQRYNRLTWWAVTLGVAGFGLGVLSWTLTEEPLLALSGLGIYYIGALAMFGLMWNSPVSLNDELDEHIQREAIMSMYMVLAIVAIFGFPGMLVLDSVGLYTAPTLVQGALWGYMLLVGIAVASHWIVKRRYR